MSSNARRARRSDPGQQSDTGSPMMKQRGGWEYPLSREEKKQRVLYLFQTELADAEKSSASNLEALHNLRENQKARPYSPCRTPTKFGAADCGDTSDRTTARARMEGCSLALLVALGAVVVAMLVNRTNESVPVDVEFPVAPPNISDRILGMRHEGHTRLQLSNCVEAEWWFSQALDLVSDKGNMSDSNLNHSVNHIIGERGFAFVCSKRFGDGASQIEKHLLEVGFDRVAPHLLNALGYAYFYLEDFHKASNFFEVGIKVEEGNPVLWNNYAAAKMAAGDLGVAHGALMYAVESLKGVHVHQKHHADLLKYNLHVLQERSEGNGEKLPAPWVDLWNGYTEAL